MLIENRKHPRFNPIGLKANIIIVPPEPNNEIKLEGTVMDMCYTGIRIKLFSPMPDDIPESSIKINLTMPESGIPITIMGSIKYLTKDSECGVHYSSENSDDEVDNLMFECIRCSKQQTKH